MNKVLDSPEYIIEPGTDFREVVNFFNTVHWSIHRMAGLHSVIERSNITGDSFVTKLDNADSTNSNIDFNGYKLYVNGSAIN